MIERVTRQSQIQQIQDAGKRTAAGGFAMALQAELGRAGQEVEFSKHAITRAEDRETVEFLFSHGEGLLIQEYLRGQEIGADCYIDMISGETVSVFTKKKLVMRAGETDKGISFQDPVLFELIERFVKESGFRGQIDIDIFECDGVYYISEVNPRFGGGYPHAYECGVNMPAQVIRNLKGEKNAEDIGNYEAGICMMKYSEVMIRRLSDK